MIYYILCATYICVYFIQGKNNRCFWLWLSSVYVTLLFDFYLFVNFKFFSNVMISFSLFSGCISFSITEMQEKCRNEKKLGTESLIKHSKTPMLVWKLWCQGVYNIKEKQTVWSHFINGFNCLRATEPLQGDSTFFNTSNNDCLGNI